MNVLYTIIRMKRFLRVTLISLMLALTLYLFLPTLENQIVDKTWVLMESSNFELPVNSEISLNFDGDVMSGNSGINSYSASYNLNGKYLNKTSFMVTEMASMDPYINELEALYLQNLEKSQSIEVNQNTLILKDENDKVVLIFVEK